MDTRRPDPTIVPVVFNPGTLPNTVVLPLPFDPKIPPFRGD